MKRKVFLSFHYALDSWRVQQVKQMGVVEEQPILSTNGWEQIKNKGDKAIEAWIAQEMSGKSCVVVLIGSKTAGRKWVTYEIVKAWNDDKGVVGIYIHRLKQPLQIPAAKGANPFDYVSFNKGGAKKLSAVVAAHDPSGATSGDVYASIKKNLPAWVEEAIQIRKNH